MAQGPHYAGFLFGETASTPDAIMEKVTKPKRKLSGAAAMGAGPGRPKGIPNKMSGELKQMILMALDQAGGVGYLVEKAHDSRSASAFLALVGKVLPMTVTSDPDAPVRVQFEWKQSGS